MQLVNVNSVGCASCELLDLRVMLLPLVCLKLLLVHRDVLLR